MGPVDVAVCSFVLDSIAHARSQVGCGGGGTTMSGKEWLGPRDWSPEKYGPGAKCIAARSKDTGLSGVVHAYTACRCMQHTFFLIVQKTCFWCKVGGWIGASGYLCPFILTCYQKSGWNDQRFSGHYLHYPQSQKKRLATVSNGVSFSKASSSIKPPKPRIPTRSSR